MVGLNEPCSIVHCSIMQKLYRHKVARQVSALSALAFHDFCTFLLVLFLSPLFTCKFRQSQRGLLLSPWHLSPRRFVTRHTCIFDCGVFYVVRSCTTNTRSLSIKLGWDGVGLGEFVITLFIDIAYSK